jgi:hypothetical protein
MHAPVERIGGNRVVVKFKSVHDTTGTLDIPEDAGSDVRKVVLAHAADEFSYVIRSGNFDQDLKDL